MEARITEALRQVIDPELGINVVDLGLIYGTAVLPNGTVQIVMTMTTPLCPLSAHLVAEAKGAVLENCPEASRIDVDLVWDPPWDPTMMSAAARAQMGWAPDSGKD